MNTLLIILGFLIYWTISAVIFCRVARNSTFYPITKYYIMALAGLIAPIAVIYCFVDKVEKITEGKNYKANDDHEHTKVMLSFGVAAYLGVHVVFALMPATVYHDDTKLIGPNGLTCYVEMTGDKKDIIRHYHCETERKLAGN